MTGEITVVGLGPGPVDKLTQEARVELLRLPKVFLRVSDHPVFHWLREQGKQLVVFECLYCLPGITYRQVYEFISQALVRECRNQGHVVYGLPGDSLFFEKTTRLLLAEGRQYDVTVRTVQGISFLETVCHELGIDAGCGLQILDASVFDRYRGHAAAAPFTDRTALLIGQFGAPARQDPSSRQANSDDVAAVLRETFPGDHRVALVWATGPPLYQSGSCWLPLASLAAAARRLLRQATLYVPPLGGHGAW